MSRCVINTEDIHSDYNKIKSIIEEYYRGINKIETSFVNFVENNRFSGPAYNSLKDYYKRTYFDIFDAMKLFCMDFNSSLDFHYSGLICACGEKNGTIDASDSNIEQIVRSMNLLHSHNNSHNNEINSLLYSCSIASAAEIVANQAKVSVLREYINNNNARIAELQKKLNLLNKCREWDRNSLTLFDNANFILEKIANALRSIEYLSPSSLESTTICLSNNYHTSLKSEMSEIYNIDDATKWLGEFAYYLSPIAGLNLFTINEAVKTNKYGYGSMQCAGYIFIRARMMFETNSNYSLSDKTAFDNDKRENFKELYLTALKKSGSGALAAKSYWTASQELDYFETSSNVNEPRPGSLIVYDHGKYGHIFFIEQVNYDQNNNPISVIASESNYNSNQNYQIVEYSIDDLKNYCGGTFKGYVYLLTEDEVANQIYVS